MKTSKGTFGFNSRYLLRGGEPWFPVMGEMHYSRCQRDGWRESLRKMKAGGVTVVSSYTIWIHHEEIEGEIDFSGNKDLRAFIQACRDCGLCLFLRIGPWCHGEVRNGGFPDWLLRYAVRTNDPAYFEQVSRFYALLFEQARGLLFKDGGPVIGVQIENEYGHCGGLTGEAGEEHMRRLTGLARAAGFDVPLYTATGWGGAVTGGLLPVMGGYCDAPWDQRTTEIEPSGNYIFTDERNDGSIGSDHRLGEGITFDMTRFPYLTAELGGGLQVTRHRRPVATGRDIGAMSLAKLGSGVNMLGYYMYHGGTNPRGKLSTLQESRETGSINDLPVWNYDFRAPIGEYGQITDSFREIKLLAMFLSDFGSELAGMPAYIPPENPQRPDNLSDLRWSVRHNGEWGFLFVNNYQRGRRMAGHTNVALDIQMNGKPVRTSPIDVESGEFCFYPFHMPVHGGVIRWATATPLCRDGLTTVFYGDEDAVFITEGNPDYRLISREDAKNAYRCGGRLIISPSPIVEDGSGGWCAIQSEQAEGCCELTALSEGRYSVSLVYPGEADDWFLHIGYRGESARAFIGGEFVADDFYAGPPWTIGLRRFGLPHEIVLEIETLREGDGVYLEKWPEMDGGAICRIDTVSMTREIQAHVP